MAIYYRCTFPTHFGNDRCNRRVSEPDFAAGHTCGLPAHHAHYLEKVEEEHPDDVSASPDIAAVTTTSVEPTAPQVTVTPLVTRQRLPLERRSTTRVFHLKYRHKDGTPDEMNLYVTAGTYADGRLGEIFLTTDRMGSFARGAIDAAATMISILLQYGVPLSVITTKLRYARFEPSGFTGDPEFPSCSSPLDLVAQWLDKRFGEKIDDS